MRVVFLDIDGVLNSVYDYTIIPSDEEKVSNQIFSRPVRILNEFIKKYDLHIVITSSWRILPRLREKIIPLLVERGLENAHDVVIGYTKRCIDLSRGYEIKKFIMEYNEDSKEKITDYVIFDDDSDMLPEQSQHFFNTDVCIGLTETIAYKAGRYLDKIIQK